MKSKTVNSIDFEVSCTHTTFTIEKTMVNVVDEDNKEQEIAVPSMEVFTQDGAGNVHHSIINFESLEDLLDLRDMIDDAVETFYDDDEEGEEELPAITSKCSHEVN